MPEMEILIPFALACLALYVTPGADMAYIVTRTVSHGIWAGFISAVAVFVGILIHILAAGLGVAVFLNASQTAFMALKYAGALYLLYLAFHLIRNKSDEAKSQPPTRHHQIFWQGVLVNVLNPKISLFMLAFLPQFVDASKGSTFAQLLILGLIFNVGGLFWSFLMVFTVARLKHGRIASAGVQKVLRWLAAGVLGGLAVRLALEER